MAVCDGVCEPLLLPVVDWLPLLFELDFSWLVLPAPIANWVTNWTDAELGRFVALSFELVEFVELIMLINPTDWGEILLLLFPPEQFAVTVNEAWIESVCVNEGPNAFTILKFKFARAASVWPEASISLEWTKSCKIRWSSFQARKISIKMREREWFCTEWITQHKRWREQNRCVNGDEGNDNITMMMINLVEQVQNTHRTQNKHTHTGETVMRWILNFTKSIKPRPLLCVMNYLRNRTQ